ncbi:hypothetical protein F2P81_014615 [Scophthalmus maximus]|uniref:Uncharacterized protein n=1 Tax=Scophthalmus maximus TaxID=52904 RepID=A0A6A4SIB0_SCOMX|nr:hypothetical protein F2P81_014615 [Scophthalmus maximus]
MLKIHIPGKKKRILTNDRAIEKADGQRITMLFAPSVDSRRDARQQSRGKLERVWPPPSKKDQFKSEQTQRGEMGARDGFRNSSSNSSSNNNNLNPNATDR